MNIGEWLTAAERQLKTHGILTARLDALVLLEDCLHTNRTHLLAHLDSALPADAQTVLYEHLKRRTAHEPLAYIRGKSEFYGREFAVSPAVLEPRPESETIIDLLKLATVDQAFRALKLPETAQLRIADVGTGSGALGITAALELPGSQVDLLEIDKSARQAAKINVAALAPNVKIYATDLLQNAPHDYDILLCNLPYVPDTYTINQAARHEPPVALFGGPDGLDLYRRLFYQLDGILNKASIILAESLPEQHPSLTDLAAQHCYRLVREDDFVQMFELDPVLPVVLPKPSHR